MLNTGISIPDGTRDTLFKEAEKIEEIEHYLAEIYKSEGYRRVITPSLEYYDVFSCAGQGIKEEAMYKLTDSNGRLLVMRADNTTPIARVIATKLRNEQLPLRLYYNESIFRINNDYSGKRSEIRQSGIEFAGQKGLESDAECITVALKALCSFGLESKLEIGHSGFSNAIIESLDIPLEEKTTLRGYLSARNEVSLGFIKNKSELDKVRQLPRLYGGPEVFADAEKLAGNNSAALQSLDYLRQLYDMLCTRGFADKLLIDMGISNTIDYYTGVVFRGYVESAGEAVLSGGRYDNLIKSFGYDIPSTGFAVNICLICDAITRREKLKNGLNETNTETESPKQ